VVNPSTIKIPWYLLLSYEFWYLSYDIIDKAFAATAHAPYQMTYA